MKIGYVRVSSKDQNLDRQLIKMEQLGIEDRFLFQDKASGKDFDRVGYSAMKKVLREGDILYIDSIDRLGRDYDGIISEWKEITRVIGCDIVALDNESIFDSRKFRAQGDIGKLMEDQFLSLLAWVAEQERKKIKTRQREGIEAARLNGTQMGRPAVAVDAERFAELYQQWKAGSIKAVEFMAELGVKKDTFYRRVKEYEAAVKS